MLLLLSSGLNQASGLYKLDCVIGKFIRLNLFDTLCSDVVTRFYWGGAEMHAQRSS